MHSTLEKVNMHFFLHLRMQSIPAMISGSWVQPTPADYFSNLRSIPWYRPSAMEFVNYESLCCSDRTCSLYIDRSLRLDDIAVWAEANLRQIQN